MLSIKGTFMLASEERTDKIVKSWSSSEKNWNKSEAKKVNRVKLISSTREKMEEPLRSLDCVAALKETSRFLDQKFWQQASASLL